MTPQPPIFELAQGRAQARMKSRSGVTKMPKPKMTMTNTGWSENGEEHSDTIRRIFSLAPWTRVTEYPVTPTLWLY